MSAIDLVNMAGVLCAVGLGVYNLVSSRRQERRAQAEEAARFRLYMQVVQGSKQGLLFQPSLGSDEYRLALNLTERGLLQSFPEGGFGVPGQRVEGKWQGWQAGGARL